MSEVIYEEALRLEQRVAAHHLRAKEIELMQRRRAMALFNDTHYQTAADSDTRWTLAINQANLDLHDEFPELCAEHEEENARLEGLRARNEAVVAAGWANQFEREEWLRTMRQRQSSEARALEAGDEPAAQE